MSGSPRRVRPEWARRLRRTRGRKIFWSTVSMGAFAAAAAGGFLWTLHESSQLEGSRRSIVLGVVGVGLVVATFDLLHPIRPKGAWLGVGMVAPAVALPLIAIALLTHADLAPFMKSLLIGAVTAQAGAMAIVMTIGLVRDIRDRTGVRG